MESGKDVKLSFSAMDIEKNDPCDFDSLRIYDGVIDVADDGYFVEDICGHLDETNMITDITRNRNDITLVFK